MNKPTLIVITGRPASGKTTLAHQLGKEIKYPLVSRDELKEGYINTVNVSHNQSGDSSAAHIYEVFFHVIEFLILKGISVIAEAAFQDKLWKPKLLNLLPDAEIKVIICEINPELARLRFKNRLENEPDRIKFHGDHLLEENSSLLTMDYKPLTMNVPTLGVDTTDGYKPEIEEIIKFIKSERASAK